ncbi:DUF3800 domain-containing protein [Pseudoalteromonas lipolytica]|uniref:DUF3800 domain-containing protein n=1 Tax=Pseudoalteromonas lipolytica TaxID=570156 RepID=A0AAD0RZ45_9GAMM|nr:DUF3800 domain-containing protein [Pseudoalteromonas donghaensis]AXV65250.1 DUF3800 domain-containing protein [Pseudoalteromonas donghaensis]
MGQNSKLKREAKVRARNKDKSKVRASISKKKEFIPTIYFDESGNTGSNLIDDNQPVFTLASCVFSDFEAKKLIDLIKSKSPNEVHFKNLQRRQSGKDAIISLMSSNLIEPSKVKISLFLKDFMIVSKIVDILIEHMMHINGEDLYINGRNIALSNMLYYCLPSFSNPETVQSMYKSFVEMVRTQDDVSINNFYSAAKDVKDSTKEVELQRNINLILDTEKYVYDALENIDKTSLDPSIPAVFLHCAQWGEIYSKGFHIVHDDSHTLEKQKEIFAQFMDWTQDEKEYGYDRRKFKLPLKGKSFRFENSMDHIQIQVADIIASSFRYWAAGKVINNEDDYLYQELDKLDLDKFIGHNIIWPTHDVTPEALGTVHDGGINAADNVPDFLAKAIPNPNILKS